MNVIIESTIIIHNYLDLKIKSVGNTTIFFEKVSFNLIFWVKRSRDSFLLENYTFCK
ncbi:hypothetical protein LEP1GSC082_0355 [Leptospira kirschneri str. H2]|nr:hypothetical protein LEP1GSC082_0355 [Leptospira kirschneri str. H2]